MMIGEKSEKNERGEGNNKVSENMHTQRSRWERTRKENICYS